MSSSSELVSNRRFSRKPSFSQTCSRLSQYLKENGSFGDLSLGMACKPHVNDQPITTMSLFPCEAVESKTLFPRQQSFSSSSSSASDVMKMTTHSTRSVKPESQTSPLTIFYGGQVIVFNDFSADKAKEVINLASKVTANTLTGSKNQTSNNVSIPNQEPVQSSLRPMALELPIARRASLHRFLEKRKDRVMSKAPYQLCDPAKVSSKPQTSDNMSWLGLAAEYER